MATNVELNTIPCGDFNPSVACTQAILDHINNHNNPHQTTAAQTGGIQDSSIPGFGFIVRTAIGVYVNRSFTISGNGLTLSYGSGISGNPVLSLNIGTGAGQVAAGNHNHTHSLLVGLQGGGGGNYYHSNQSINKINSPQFAGLTLTGNLNKIQNVSYVWPLANSVGYLINDGSGNLTWSNFSSPIIHDQTSGISGGDPLASIPEYYHLSLIAYNVVQDLVNNNFLHNNLSGRSALSVHPALSISYNNISSTLISSDVQNAIDELDAKIISEIDTHNELLGLQGGDPLASLPEYYHISLSQLNSLSNFTYTSYDRGQIGSGSNITDNTLQFLDNRIADIDGLAITPGNNILISKSASGVIISTVSHNLLTGLDGGDPLATIPEYYHLSYDLYNNLVTGGPAQINPTNASGVLPVDGDVSGWANNTLGIVKGNTGRIFITFKNTSDVYYVEMTSI